MTESSATPARSRALSGKQARFLRALAHPLEVVVTLGKDGVSEGVLGATRAALLDHELIKARMPELERDERRAMAEALAGGAEAQLVDTIGRVAILYKRHPSKPQIVLPRAAKSTP